MAGYVMTAEQYRRHGISGTSPKYGDIIPFPSRRADRPEPSNVTDGRFWGDEVWADMFSPTSAATAEQAAKNSAVNYCVSIIAEAIGSVSLDMMEGDRPAPDFYLGDVLAYAPNLLQTGAEFWASMAFQAAIGGVAFAEPTYDGTELQVWPLPPSRYSVDWGERTFVVNYTPEGATIPRRMLPQQLFWFSGLADACMKPLVPWKMAKGQIDFAMALESQGKTFFQNGRRLQGVLSTERMLTNEMKEKLQRGMRGWRDGHNAVLDAGVKYAPVAAPNTDSQFLELIKQRTIELARYWRIPRSMVGEDGGTAASQEQQAMEFVKYTLRPWVRRIEQAISQRLLTPEQRRRYRAKFNLDSLLRGDSATQWKNAVLARTAGIASIDELRTGWFGMPAIGEDWSQDARAPLNSNRAADTATGGQTAPQDMVDSNNG